MHRIIVVYRYQDTQSYSKIIHGRINVHLILDRIRDKRSYQYMACFHNYCATL